MPVLVESFTIYHSPNAYLGTVLLRRGLEGVNGIELRRRPIFVPRERGVMIAEMLEGRENRNAGSYNREDCARWAARHRIAFNYPPPEVFRDRAARWERSPWHREELPARAFYAAPPAARERLDMALFEAAWVEGLDVNDPETVRRAATKVGLDAAKLLADAETDSPGGQARAALTTFDRAACPGVPTVVVAGERFFGKDRVDWAVETAKARLST
jgi:2-hydroxychromene-2-carboxylate isomerase